MPGIATVVLVASALVGQAEPTETPLTEFGDVFVGRWLGDVTLAADWKGVGKKGEKIVSYATFKWIADRRAIETELHGGKGMGKALTVWDAGSKSIRQLSVSSGGRTYEMVLSKDGDRWKWELNGSLGDGTKLAGKGHYIVDKGGKRFVSEGFVKVRNEKPSRFRDVWVRLN